MPRKDPGMPYDLAPMLKARFGQPDDCADLVNKEGDAYRVSLFLLQNP